MKTKLTVDWHPSVHLTLLFFGDVTNHHAGRDYKGVKDLI